MCLSFGKPKIPTVAPAPKLPEAPKEIDEAVQKARGDQRRRAAAGRSFGSTLLTPTSGTGAATIQKQTLLGGALSLG